MIILKRNEDGVDMDVRLMDDVLQQDIHPNPKARFREVRMTDLQKFFQWADLPNYHTSVILGRYENQGTFCVHWKLVYDSFAKTFSIGCVDFNAEETAIIRKWLMSEVR